MKRRRLNILLLAIATTVILIGSMMPAAAKVALGTEGRITLIELWSGDVLIDIHRAVHMIAFGILAGLLLSLMHTWPRRLLAASAVCILAVATEIAESAVYKVGMEWNDVKDDSVGVAAALLITLLITLSWRRPREIANPAASEK